MKDCCKEKKNPRSDELIANIKRRINKINGQLNGINKMIDENRYCGDILIQIAAVENALKEVGYLILEDHMCSCVTDDIKNGDNASLLESIEIMKRLK